MLVFMAAHSHSCYVSRPKGHFRIVRFVCRSVPYCICLRHRHAVCLQLSHRRPSEMCGLRTRPQTDTDPPPFFDRTAIGGGHIVSPPPGRYLATTSTRICRISCLRWLGSRVVSVLDSGAEGPGCQSQPRSCRVTVLGKLFTPIVPLITKQQNR